MRVSRFSRRILVILGFGVALPALILAGLGMFLTLRIGGAVESQSARYHRYMAAQVAEGFEQELLAELRESIATAENAARNDAPPTVLLQALEVNRREFRSPHFVPLDQLTDYLLLIVESQPLVYGPDVPDPEGRRFAGMMLRDSKGQVVGAGGWWLDARYFLVSHLREVIEERLANNPRIYGGPESIRNLSVV